jgi:hypothetical protein
MMVLLKRNEGGESVPNLCREIGISTATFYTWPAKFGGMGVSMLVKRRDDGILREHWRHPRFSTPISSGSACRFTICPPDEVLPAAISSKRAYHNQIFHPCSHAEQRLLPAWIP